MISIGERRALEARLAPDGWEQCGTWFIYVWFKRPKAASVGPAAAISSLPEAPARRSFLSRRFYLLAAVAAAAVIVSGAVRSVLTGDVSEGLGLMTGLVVGGLVPLAAVAAWRNRSR